jgi:putative amide transporter protein
MSAIGLIYCGAVLFVNAMMLLGRVDPRSAAILNLFVGTLQVVTPTVLILRAGADNDALLSASGIYLFGFTFLFVGIVNLTGLPADGIGWYSAFVAAAAVVYSLVNFTSFHDPVFGVIWLAWAALWLEFFGLMALGRESLTRPTGWSLLLLGQVTTTVPAYFILTGHYDPTRRSPLSPPSGTPCCSRPPSPSAAATRSRRSPPRRLSAPSRSPLEAGLT